MSFDMTWGLGIIVNANAEFLFGVLRNAISLIGMTARVFDLTVLTTDSDFDHLHDPHPTRPWRVDREWVDPTSKLTP